MISPDIATETRFKYSQFLIDNNVRAVANVLIIVGLGEPPFGILQIDSQHEVVCQNVWNIEECGSITAGSETT